jgi:hypothetical protein
MTTVLVELDFELPPERASELSTPAICSRAFEEQAADGECVEILLIVIGE